MLVEGYLRKNHNSQVYAKANVKRFFVAEGFTVFYYTDAKKATVKGHFDLRNVIKIRAHDPTNPDAAPASEDEPGAVDLRIADPRSPNQAPKMFIISFADCAPDVRASWLTHFCSAVLTQYVDESLRRFVDRTLGDSFDANYGDVEAVSARRSKFGRRAPTTQPLTPREPMAESATTSADQSQFDTPRPAPLSRPQPNGTEAAQADEESTFEITVPDNVKPGDRVQATTPRGLRVKLTVPEGAEAGTILTFALSQSSQSSSDGSGGSGDREQRAAVLIQSRARGTKARKTQQAAAARGGTAAATEPVQLAATVDMETAATKLQSTFRGHTARNDQQEEARLQWMRYYMHTSVADFEEALSLAVTPEEEDFVLGAKAALEKEEQTRATWFGHYLQMGRYVKAGELAVTPAEAALVIKARALATLGPCACCFGDAIGIEKQRSATFKESIRSYDWGAAEILATTTDEAQDVVDSRLRVKLMEEALAGCNYAAAYGYAITAEEMARISELAAPRPQRHA